MHFLHLVTIRKMRSFNLTAKHLPKLPHMLYRNDCIYICTHHHHYIYCPPQSHHSEMRSISSPNNELWRLDCDFTYLIYLNYHRSANSSIINGFEWKQNKTRKGSKCALYRDPYIYITTALMRWNLSALMGARTRINCLCGWPKKRRRARRSRWCLHISK